MQIFHVMITHPLRKLTPNPMMSQRDNEETRKKLWEKRLAHALAQQSTPHMPLNIKSLSDGAEGFPQL